MKYLKQLITLLTISCSSVFSVAGTSIVVNPEKSGQTIEGFGSSINAWTAPFYGLYYNDDFTRFAVDELGMSVFRLQMWGNVSMKPVENWQDISYLDFKWTGEGLRGKMDVDWAKRIVQVNPAVKIIGSIWSPPGWMKENNSTMGTQGGFLLSDQREYDRDNHLRKDRYMHFAKWVVEWARYMESQGTPFYAISLQNELMFTQWYESTLYTPEQYAEVVRITGEMFESEGVRKPLFFGPEDMTLATYADEVRHKPYVDALMEPEVRRYFDVLATHGYSDGIEADAKNSPKAYWDSVKHLGMPFWITEGGTGGHDWPEPVMSGIAPRLHYALEESNVSLFCGWQLTGVRGAGTSHDFMAWDQPTPKTYTTMHFWKHLRPGAVRVETSVSDDENSLLVSSYRHDRRGEGISILINQSAESREVSITWAGYLESSEWKVWQTSADQNHQAVQPLEAAGDRITVRLPPLSITTVVGYRGKP